MYDAVKHYLREPKRGGLRVCANYKEVLMNFGRITGYAYGFKEHGSKWMQQNAMLMYGMYHRGFVNEGYEIYKEIYHLCMDSGVTRTFPCIPSFIDKTERGAYTYLTASATWLLLAVTTQMYGIRGEHGNLCIEPKLMKEQFNKDGKSSVSITFQNKKLEVVFENPSKKNYGSYSINEVIVGDTTLAVNNAKAIIEKSVIEKLDGNGVSALVVRLS
jgi:cellobiose phosphorylase